MTGGSEVGPMPYFDLAAGVLPVGSLVVCAQAASVRTRPNATMSFFTDFLLVGPSGRMVSHGPWMRC